MNTKLACLYRLLAGGILAVLMLTAAAQDKSTLSVAWSSQPAFFPLVSKAQTTAIYIEPGAEKVVSIAAHALQQDIHEITGVTLPLEAKPAGNTAAVIIGTIGKKGLIDALSSQGKLATAAIAGKWESYTLAVINNPLPGIPRALVIAGSDTRGTAFGVFELCRLIGVSPFTWWADVHPAPHSEIYVSPGQLLQGPPAVKYRGIFLNDEDWGLQPWAAHKMDTAVKDIGPHTYARIFELLLRLKANYIWPAMHPCTKAFYYYPDNPRLASEYSIVVGSSHCEPMLRNNVFEWAENYTHEYGSAPGEWRYDRNKTQIYNYWKDRVQQSGHYESVYTVGMRGIHDGSMPGPASMPEKVKLMQEIISDQRQLLGNGTGKPPQDIPQIFCPYKEVLNVYRNGLSLPDDVTIVWADDNHGYIRQLSNEQEQHRSGRSGVYYHLSYWGAPQDYLWLSSVSPTLMSYEMTKAYHYGADRLWVFNVGDIKPAEMELEFAMDLAWDPDKWPPTKVTVYIHDWAARTFGSQYADDITRIKEEYYVLAQSGKPEHINNISFSNEEADRRLSRYRRIAEQAETLYSRMPDKLKDAFFELVLYPVEGARRMNEKILYARLSLQLAAAGRQEALLCAQKAQEAFATIQQLTARYNDSTAGGKWSGIMSWHPRNQPVFNMPSVATQKMIDSAKAAGITTPPVKTHPRAVGGDRRLAGRLSLPITIPAFTALLEMEHVDTCFRSIPGLGADGNGMTIFPFIPAGDAGSTNADTILANKHWLEYSVDLNPGTFTLLVKCLPAQSVSSNGRLRYAVSINGEAPQLVNIHTESESRAWKENVLRGFALGKSVHTTATAGPATIRLYFLDPGLVINQLEID